MAKIKKPAPKGGKKAAAPKKGLRAPVKGRQRGEKIAKQSVADAGEFVAPLHPTVEEQFDRDASLMQALHDPENQPSQYGTVPMSYLDNLPASYCNKPSLLRRAINRVKRAFRFRSAKSGEYVTPEYAAANPDTTVREKA